MSRKKEQGVYLVGRVNEDKHSNRRGDYYAIQGEKANNRSHVEWRPVDFLNENKWYAVRVGPTEQNTRRTNSVAHPIAEFERKGGILQYLDRNVQFDEKY